MKNAVKKLAFAVLLVLLSGQARAQEARRNQKAVIQTNIYCDHCKECETCGKTFQSGLMKIKGLKMYALDEEKMTITVYYDPRKTNLETIKTAITDLGYDADDLKANPLAYEKLEGCCQKT
jgi:copper chaperone CopZ